MVTFADTMVALGSVTLVTLEAASLKTLPYACIYPSNQLDLRGNPMDLCSCEMAWLLGNRPDAVVVDDMMCKDMSWRDFLAANCGRDKQETKEASTKGKTFPMVYNLLTKVYVIP